MLSAYALEDADGLRRCPVCRRLKRPFAQAVAYGSYEGELRELVHLLKYNGVRPAAKVLGKLMAAAFNKLNLAFEQGIFQEEPILVVPVPLHKAKRRERGFNQAELIARMALQAYVGKAHLELASDILLRRRETLSQIGLTGHARRENLRGAFSVQDPAELMGRSAILVDDVYTTGSTVAECARVLRRAGASEVWVATVARTLKTASNYVDDQRTGSAGVEVSESEEASLAISR